MSRGSARGDTDGRASAPGTPAGEHGEPEHGDWKKHDLRIADLPQPSPAPAAARSGQPGKVGVPRPAPFAGWGRAEGHDGEGVLQRAETRHTIELSTGVRWERLTPRPDSRVDFLDVVYEPYGRSS